MIDHIVFVNVPVSICMCTALITNARPWSCCTIIPVSTNHQSNKWSASIKCSPCPHPIEFTRRNNKEREVTTTYRQQRCTSDRTSGQSTIKWRTSPEVLADVSRSQGHSSCPTRQLMEMEEWPEPAFMEYRCTWTISGRRTSCPRRIDEAKPFSFLFCTFIQCRSTLKLLSPCFILPQRLIAISKSFACNYLWRKNENRLVEVHPWSEKIIAI